jgi:putative cardiolipin synthase
MRIKLRGLTISIAALGLLYVLAGCGATVDWHYPRTPSTALAAPETTTVGALFKAAADRHPGQSGFALIQEGSRAFTARLAMTDLAEKTLDAQYYIWDVDTTGRIMAQRLIQAADRGVRVRLLLDDHYQTERLDAGIAALDAHPNIEVRFFNPVANRRWRTFGMITDFGRINHRMHNKLFIMDNAVGIAGGRNIADIYFGVRADQNFRDLDMAMAGPIVKDLSASFDRFWNSAWAVPAGAVVDQRATAQDFQAMQTRLNERVAAAGYPYPIEERIAELRARIVEIRDGFIWGKGRVLADDPARVSGDDGGQVLKHAVLEQLTDAKQEVLIESPYFILLESGMAQVRALVARGIKVRVLTNSTATNDVLPAQAGYANTRKALLEAGVELYELRPDSNMKREWSMVAGRSRASLHAKALVIDRKTVFIGSFNIDPRSNVINTEIGVLIESPEVARQLSDFMDDGVKPGSAFRLTLDPDGDLLWTAETNGKKLQFDTEPETTLWHRVLLDLVGLLPIEEQL